MLLRSEYASECYLSSIPFHLQGNFDKISSSLSENWWEAVKMNWYMWIPAQMINFALVPLQFRVLFSNVVALAWNTYLSWASHK